MIPVAAILGGGCSSTGRWDMLSAQEKGVFSRCRNHTIPTFCGDVKPSQTFVYLECTNQMKAAYSRRKQVRDRRTWLVENGCPPAMVEPSYHMSPAAAVPRRPPAESAPCAELAVAYPGQTSRPIGMKCQTDDECMTENCVMYVESPPAGVCGQVRHIPKTAPVPVPATATQTEGVR